MQRLILLTLGSLCCITAHSADLKLTVEVPTLTVAEYHRPYVAVWIEREDSSVAANLAVWYQQGKRPPGQGKPGGKPREGDGKDGTEWLKDLRQWWRRSGRSQQMPLDGVSGATRAAGAHTLSYSGAQPPLSMLAAGSYRIVVEAAREVGGRELLKLPFSWPPQPAQPQTVQVKGKTELGSIELSVNP